MDALRQGAVSLVVVLSACGAQHPPVDAARLTAADGDTANWLTYGRTYDEQRFSPLKQINTQSVRQLKLAWHYDLDAAHRVQETTPLIVDGVMYVTSAWSKVFALDPATGRQIWAFDPAVPGITGVKGCCDVANRGVAFWNGKVYVGTFDGRLIALDARTGKQVWSVQTSDPAKSYTITGAPRIVKGRVIIGNGGGEYITRGYVTAYDAETGKHIWRFYTVPGEPGKPDGAASDQVLERKARSTWHGEFWKNGGGGTVWDSMAYDPKLDLLYIGTDNGSPWNRAIRSPGGGDNLFIASIIALRPDTGEYVWHFQESPGESWDFSAAQHIMLADLQINGKLRHVLMQAPKNGFFYVLDRETGAFIAARPFATVNWALSLDPDSGRPTENPQARYGETGKPWVSLPGPAGAHSWQPMSYSPLTGLVYLPVSEAGFVFIGEQKFKPKDFGWNTGVDFNAGSLPEDPKAVAGIKTQLKGRLSAWNPVTQREVWRVQYDQPWNGGVLATAGNLVFQGNSMGEFAAFQADDGKRVWSVQTDTGIVAPPVSYEVNGEQYVAVEVGWGGAFGLAAGVLAHDSQVNRGNMPRLLAFKLNGTDSLPGPPNINQLLEPPPDTASTAVVTQGKLHYHTYCSMCHGDSAVSGGVLPDLRYSAALGNASAWQSIVHDGVRQANGMVSFGEQMNKDEIEAIRSYVVHRASEQVAGDRKQ
ncbi:MAG TPA: PQQ-dependent dehydrogenase, methanol/ethanol family [Steroidobacteraceae bacterium]|nr:PQQ-dependent dehydrogenase, methanol/ethanol family [Steroidobacteraceae bacterium]